MITRLSGADALAVHTESWKAPAHTIALIVIEASDQLSHQRLHRLVAASLPQIARFRSRLVSKPLGVGQPIWAEIDDYDPSSQIHRATLSEPGGHPELAAFIAELSTGRHDGNEPLWEAWSVNGLAAGRWALAVKMSPALNDGTAGATSLWPRLLSTEPRLDPADNLPIEPSLGFTPSVGELMTDVIAEIVENQVTGAWLVAQTVSGLLQTLLVRLRGTGVPEPVAPASSISKSLPQTAFNAPLTGRRALAFASIPLADVKAVSDAFGGSLTNVVVAACTLSLRAWLQQHDRVPEGPLLMRMPFEAPATHLPEAGNALTVGRFRIPIQLDDPVQVLANLHTATENLNAIRSRSDKNRSTAIAFATIASLIPPTATKAGMRLYHRFGLRHQLSPRCHGSVSYTVGESAPVYCAGAKVVGMHTVAPLTERSGLNISVVSRAGELDVSVCACPDNVPAVDDIATGIAHCVQRLAVAAQESPRGKGRSVVSEMTSHPAHRSRRS